MITLVALMITEDGEMRICNGNDLHEHMCTLNAWERNESIKRLSDRPVVVCKHCGAKANSLKNICATSFSRSDS